MYHSVIIPHIVLWGFCFQCATLGPPPSSSSPSPPSNKQQQQRKETTTNKQQQQQQEQQQQRKQQTTTTTRTTTTTKATTHNMADLHRGRQKRGVLRDRRGTLETSGSICVTGVALSRPS